MPTLPLVSAPAFLLASVAEIGRKRARVDLHGFWERQLNGQPYDAIRVPSSQRPLGLYHLKRKFLLPRIKPGERVFVHFDAILYHGRVFLNGAVLGTMGPYVPYEFEFTAQAREGANEIDVQIADLTPEPGGAGKDEIALGWTGGWESASGIIRDVYVEFRAAAHIDNVRFAYQLTKDYAQATCRARLFLSSPEETSGHVDLRLLHGYAVVAQAGKDVLLPVKAGEVELEFAVESPLLWSPQTPNLYRLVATLRTSSCEDEWCCPTGFRDVRIRGNTFELNGSRLVLGGVCRHDLWKDQGFTLTREQMAQDMRMIKSMGANFVRLVHYPHHRHIIELADELGLFVTQEPCNFGVHFDKVSRSRVEASLTVMERVIRRDWNSPSVFAWLLGNECSVTLDYLREGKALCNRLDPIVRPVSFADIFNDNRQELFDAAGLDFYDRHMYGFDTEKFQHAAGFSAAKPLVHTEWGWELVDWTKGASPWPTTKVVYERSFDRLLEGIEQGKVSGHSFFSWQDLRQYSRVDWSAQDGILLSGVVDEAREPREALYMGLSRLFEGRRSEEPLAPRDRPDPVPLRFHAWSPKNQFETVDLQHVAESEPARKGWSDLAARMARHWPDQWKRCGEKLLFWQGAELEIGGVNFRTPVIDGRARPLVLTPDCAEIAVPVERGCVRLHFLGHVTLPSGYPLLGAAGEEVGEYVLEYAGGGTQRVPLRNGIEVARANLIHQATRIDPMATMAPRALAFTRDIVREQFQVLLFSLPVRGGKLQRLRLKLNPSAQPLAIFAITSERESRKGQRA